MSQAVPDQPLFPSPAPADVEPDDAPLFGGPVAPRVASPRRSVEVPTPAAHVPNAGAPLGLTPPPGPMPPSGPMPPPVAPAASTPPSSPTTSTTSAPPSSPPSPPPSPKGPTGRPQLTGVIDGPVSLDAQQYRPWGLRALVIAVLLYAVYFLVSLVRAMFGHAVHGSGSTGSGGTGSLLSQLLSLFSVLLVMLFAVSMVFRGVSGKRGGSGSGLLGPLLKATGTVLAAVLKLFGQGVAAAFKGGSATVRSTGASELSRPVRRFRVRELTGEVTACTLLGELLGDDLRQGDVVRVYGRDTRRGHIKVRRAEVLTDSSGSVVSTVATRTARRFLLLIWLDRASWVVALVILGFLAVVAGRALS